MTMGGTTVRFQHRDRGCEWMDGCDMGYQLLSDEDIIKEVTQSEEVENIEEHEDTNEEDSSTIPTSGEVKDMLDQCLMWCKRQGECIPSSLVMLKKV